MLYYYKRWFFKLIWQQDICLGLLCRTITITSGGKVIVGESRVDKYDWRDVCGFETCRSRDQIACYQQPCETPEAKHCLDDARKNKKSKDDYSVKCK